ncbi:hypothetical protein SARC_06310 [Sphaeroforma arctica JP610]|uniref:Succinate dehydrogenase [ubiquinone] cytochrome b small subunit n=1 Tax=Sphaeroforma arctica JP610 TaxID=667725 RepID=A0A0L0FXS6_9EUKA|nr:hypothetical protein SARC_06310 [Sphaeroforma arctica JP610]KNC81366.1 hypothetical protein SARC_06310 [Sphaeroforma arctica JP610]|eukprot:XP_014155268.1 hypothetical protein SARC_06310 [Sphaeroforma arctica JP610]
MSSAMFTRLTPAFRQSTTCARVALTSRFAGRNFHAAPVAMQAMGMKESTHWKAERVVSVGSLALIPAAAVVGPSLPIDMAMAVVLPLHSYWGMEQVFTDYAKGIFAPLSTVLNVVVHVGTVGGLIMFNLNDVGITKAVQQLWAL